MWIKGRASLSRSHDTDAKVFDKATPKKKIRPMDLPRLQKRSAPGVLLDHGPDYTLYRVWFMTNNMQLRCLLAILTIFTQQYVSEDQLVSCEQLPCNHGNLQTCQTVLFQKCFTLLERTWKYCKVKNQYEDLNITWLPVPSHTRSVLVPQIDSSAIRYTISILQSKFQTDAPNDAKMTLNTTRSKIPIFICYTSLLELEISKKKKQETNLQ